MPSATIAPVLRFDLFRVVEQRPERWLMQDRATHQVGLAQDETECDHARKRGTEDSCRCKAERFEQPRGVIRLLFGRGRRPTRRSGAPPVAPAVIGDDRELIRKEFGEPLKIAAIAGCAHDQQNRRAGTSDLVVKLGAVYLEHAIKAIDGSWKRCRRGEACSLPLASVYRNTSLTPPLDEQEKSPRARASLSPSRGRRSRATLRHSAWECRFGRKAVVSRRPEQIGWERIVRTADSPEIAAASHLRLSLENIPPWFRWRRSWARTTTHSRRAISLPGAGPSPPARQPRRKVPP